MRPPPPRVPPTLAALAVAWLAGVLIASQRPHLANGDPARYRIAASLALAAASGATVGFWLQGPSGRALRTASQPTATGATIGGSMTYGTWSDATNAQPLSVGASEHVLGHTVPGQQQAQPARQGLSSARRLLVLAALWCLAGALRYASAVPRPDSGHVAAHNGQQVELVGRIVAEPDQRDQRIGYRLRVDELRSQAGPKLAHGLVLAWGPVHPLVAYGALVLVRGRLETPRQIEGFDYAGYLARQGIHSVIQRASLEVLDTGGGNPLFRALLAIKAVARQRLALALPQPESALATGILLGDDKAIPSHTAEAFRRTNTSHVIAISGSNVSLLVMALTFLLAGRLSRRQSVPIILATLILYAILVGADPAVVRATIMGSLMVVARTLGRQADALIGLLAAAWAMTLFRPIYAHDLGFQLSFAATLGLIVLVPRLNAMAALLAAYGRERAGSRSAKNRTPADSDDHRSHAALAHAACGGKPLAAEALEAVQEDHFVPGPTPTERLPPARWFSEAVTTSVAAQLTTWPIIAYQVGQVSLAGLLANFLIVPVQPLVMGLGALTILAGIAQPTAGRIVGAVAWLPLAFTIRTVEASARLPLAAVPVSMPGHLLALYYTALAVALLWPTRTIHWLRTGHARDSHEPTNEATPARLPGPAHRPAAVPVATLLVPCFLARFAARWRQQLARHANPLLALLAAACLLVWLAVFQQPDRLLHVRMLDVGQGDAILVVAPNGRRLLVDGGPAPSAVLDRLGRYFPPWDRRLDVVVLTHPDADHLGGLPAVLERYRVMHVVDSVASADTPNAVAWQEALAKTNSMWSIAAAGSRIILDQRAGVWADVLWPPVGLPPDSASDPNALSTVLRLQYGHTAVLLTGDLEADGEAALLAAEAPLRADVLKVAHHGSLSSTTPGFLSAVQPRLALIGVGAGNRFGHPVPDVLARLSGVPVLRTDYDGDIEVLSDGHDIWLAGSRRRFTGPARPRP